jgi:hypothetical protein
MLRRQSGTAAPQVLKVMTRPLALVAFLVLVGCGGEGNGGDIAGSQALTLDLAAQNSSGQSGTARLTAEGEKTRIVVELANAPDVAQPSHVHEGTCDDIGDVVAPLENVVDGRAEGVVDMSLAELRRGRLIVHAHKSEAEYDTSVACAEIPSTDASGSGY